MFTKRLLTISLLLPLAAISATARAGSTITDKSYWPSEARQQTVQARTAASPSEKNSAFAYEPAAPRLQPAPNATNGATWSYHGGPKYPR